MLKKKREAFEKGTHPDPKLDSQAVMKEMEEKKK
jgi:hypothetical protein